VSGNTFESSGEKHVARIARLKLSDKHKHDLQEILATPVAYVHDERFRRPVAMAAIMQQNIDVLPGTTLTPQEEQILFLRLNYARYKMDQLRRRLLRVAKWTKKNVLELLEFNQKQLDVRSKIAGSNLGLVLAMAKRVSYYGVEMADLVSEGNVALLRTINLFNCSRGCKFSTYACNAILKSFSRAAKHSYRYRNLFPVQFELAFEKSDHTDWLRQERYHDQVQEVRNIMHNNLADLSEIELSVLRNRFPINKENPEPLTLKQVGEQLDLSKERVRQIQKKAITKLREIVEQRLVAI